MGSVGAFAPLGVSVFGCDVSYAQLCALPALAGTGARDAAMASVEVLAGPERRRRWSIEQKQAIVTAAFGLMAPAGNGAAVPAVPAIEIEFASNARVRIPASVSPALAAAVVEALARR